MKIAIVDEMVIRGKHLDTCIKKLFPDTKPVLILGSDATGPRASMQIHKFVDNFDHIFVHHSQLEVAEKLPDTNNIILYSAFYNNNAEKHGGVWIQENVSELSGASSKAISMAMGLAPQNISSEQPQDMHLPPISNLGAWHALATPDMSLEQLETHFKAIEEQHGGIQDVSKYRDLYGQDPQKAYLFADKMKAAIKNRASKYDQSLRFYPDMEYTKREFNVLLVDDNKDNYIILKEKLNRYLLDNDEPFEANIIHIENTEYLYTKFKKLRNIQAVIFDDRFPTDVNISETIEHLTAIRPIPFYISGSNILACDQGSTKQYSPIFVSNVRAYEYKDEKRATALFDGLLADLKARIETPYFTALNKYATERKSAFHALPITDGGSLNDSMWAREFTDFYRRKFFAAETSNTKAPLSSVFSPQGELQRALEKAAEAFHADRTLFITSGTTISNLLVYKIHIQKNDIVLLDWNCHKSHHNAMVECGARVKYLQSEYNRELGIAGLVPTEQILQQLQILKEAGEPVKMISLTHPSFDGMLYDVEELMREANKVYPGIVFFFDEAWFAYGAFHPVQNIRHRSAMLAAAKIRTEAINETGFRDFPTKDVRVYVTHSIHKTLSSIRQGSMLHIHDPYLTFACEADRLHLKYMIDNAYETYITTSPNNSILGSLDVARMQAEMEAYDRINHAIDCVQVFKKELQVMSACFPAVKAMSLRVVEPEELIANSDNDKVLIDPLKITLYFDRVPGAKAVKSLNEFNIQINKYSANTILLLFSIGVTRGNVNHLLRSLKAWAEKVVTTQPYTEDNRLDGQITDIPNFHEDFLVNPQMQITCLKNVHDKLHSSLIPGDDNTNSNLFQSATPVSITSCLTDEPWATALENNQLVTAQAITPYPPGSPIIVAGQILSREILASLIKLNKTGGEINGIVKSEAGEDCIIVSNRGANER